MGKVYQKSKAINEKSKIMMQKPSFLSAITKEPRLMPLINYILLFFMVMTLGFSALVVLIIATFAEPKAQDWLRTHYIYQIRTFWIGIGPVLLTNFIGTYVSRQGINAPMLIYGLVLICLVWAVGRSVIGFNHLFNSRPIPKPNSFWI